MHFRKMHRYQKLKLADAPQLQGTRLDTLRAVYGGLPDEVTVADLVAGGGPASG